MGTTETGLPAHLVTAAGYPGEAFNKAVCEELHERFKIGHSTIRIEINDSLPSCGMPQH